MNSISLKKVCVIIFIMFAIMNIDIYSMISTSYSEYNFKNQLNELYDTVAYNLNIDPKYVKIVHLIAGGKAVYEDKLPDIYSDLTIDYVKSAFYIDGATQYFNIMAPWTPIQDDNMKRPNRRYLPDAAYSVMSEIVRIMNMRYNIDRGNLEKHFEALENDVKNNIIFYESVLEYINSDRIIIEKLFEAYEHIIYNKDEKENIVELVNSQELRIKEKFLNILKEHMIIDERSLEVLAIMFSFDEKLASSNDIDSIRDSYLIPYEIDVISRENLLLAAFSLVGKVRYVWGGGHLGTANIEGINPAWLDFHNRYPNKVGINGYNTCIQPIISWCPIHGAVDLENGCLDISKKVYSIYEYIDDRDGLDDKFIRLINGMDFSNGMLEHRLDGLDCSGYTGWVYNQICPERVYDSAAYNFIEAGELISLGSDAKMMPGDVFLWKEHIVLIVGKINNSSNIYTVLEASPNVVKFGTLYNNSATTDEINYANQIADEANKLFGNLHGEPSHLYNIESIGLYKNEDNEEKYFADSGRLPYTFIDNTNIIDEYGLPIKDMVSKDIIQYILDNIGIEYVSGMDTYDGSLFNTSIYSSKIDTKLIQNINNIMSTKNNELVNVEQFIN